MTRYLVLVTVVFAAISGGALAQDDTSTFEPPSREEMRAEREARREALQNMTEEERQAAREAWRAEARERREQMRAHWESLSDEERQALREERKGRKGMGRGGRHRGGKRHQDPAEDDAPVG